MISQFITKVITPKDLDSYLNYLLENSFAWIIKPYSFALIPNYVRVLDLRRHLVKQFGRFEENQEENELKWPQFEREKERKLERIIGLEKMEALNVENDEQKNAYPSINALAEIP